jgi:hypothetical protein
MALEQLSSETSQEVNVSIDTQHDPYGTFLSPPRIYCHTAITLSASQCTLVTLSRNDFVSGFSRVISCATIPSRHTHTVMQEAGCVRRHPHTENILETSHYRHRRFPQYERQTPRARASVDSPSFWCVTSCILSVQHTHDDPSSQYTSTDCGVLDGFGLRRCDVCISPSSHHNLSHTLSTATQLYLQHYPDRSHDLASYRISMSHDSLRPVRSPPGNIE